MKQDPCLPDPRSITQFSGRKVTIAPRNEKRPMGAFGAQLAGRGGFEPPRRYKRLPDFESGTFNRSATSPEMRVLRGPGRTPGAQ